MGRLFFILFIIALSILILLFFPIYLDTNLHYDMNGKKLAFSVRAYKLIKLVGGYIATYRGGLAAHLSSKKAVLIPYTDFDNERKRFSVFRTFRLKSLEITTETGADYLISVAAAQAAFRILFFAMGGKKEKIENNLWLSDGDMLRVSVYFVIRFNLFIILRNLIKAIKEKIKVLCQTKMKSSTI